MRNKINSILQSLLIRSLLGISMILIFTFSDCGDPDFGPAKIISQEGGVAMVDIKSFEIGRGGSKDITVEIERIGVSTGEVSLSVLDTLSTDISITFDPNPIPSNSSSSNMHIEVAANAQIEDHLINVHGKLGAFTAGNSFTMSVVELAFSLNDIDPITIQQGEIGVVPISINIGGADPIRLVAKDFPAGVDTSFSPNPTTIKQSALTLAVDASVAPGNYNILVTGFNGTTPSTPKGFVLTVTAPSTLWVDVTPTTISALNDVSFIDEMNGVAVGDDGTIFSTGSGGVSGSWNNNSGVTTSKLNGVHSDGTTWYAVGDGETILRNTGSGWTSVGSDITNDLLDVFVVNSNKIFISGKNGKVYRTENGGGLWDELEPFPGATQLITGIWVNNDSIVTVVTSGVGRIHRSTNNGNDWTILSTAQLFDVKYVNSSLGFAAGQLNLVYMTFDGGANWSNIALNFPTNELLSVSFFNSNIGYVVGTNQAIWRTGSGGGAANDWVVETIDPNSNDVLEGVAALNNENVIAVGSGFNGGIILRREP